MNQYCLINIIKIIFLKIKYTFIDQVTNFDDKVAQIVEKVKPLLSEDVRQSIKDFSMR